MMKKPAWHVEPTLIDLLSRRGSSWSQWLLESNAKTWEDVEEYCQKIGVKSPNRKEYEKDLPKKIKPAKQESPVVVVSVPDPEAVPVPTAVQQVQEEPPKKSKKSKIVSVDEVEETKKEQ